MLQRPQRGDPFWIWMLHWWEVLSWAIIALVALISVFGSAPADEKYGSLALMAVLVVCYTVVRTRPGNPVMLGYAYVGVLILILGGLAGLRSGFGIFYTLTLPQFVVFANGLRGAVIGSGLGAAAITIGGAAREGLGLDSLGSNGISSAGVYAFGVVFAVLTPKAIALRDERAVLRKELKATQEELAAAVKREGAVEERQRLAREIHDTLAQGFASIIVLAEAARAGIDTEPARSAQQLLSIENTARENLTEARALVGAAPEHGITQDSVSLVLRRTLDRFAEDTGLVVEADLYTVECDQQTRITLLRCTQESLANIRKHAQATTVNVVLSQNSYGVELEIADDGRGFVPEESRGFGLDGMRRRLDELGGELTVASSVGDGTLVLAMIPTNGQV